MRLYNRLYSSMRVLALFVGISLVSAFCGGNLFDIDHFFYYLGWLPDGRFLHEVFFVVSIVAVLIGGCGLIALLRRLYRDGVLK